MTERVSVMDTTSTTRLKYKKGAGGALAAVVLAFGISFAGAGSAMANSFDPLGDGDSGGPGSSTTTTQNEDAPSAEEIQRQLDDMAGDGNGEGSNGGSSEGNSGDSEPVNENKADNPNNPDTPGSYEDPSGVNDSEGGEFIRNYQPLSEFNPSDSPFMNGLLAGVGKITSFLIWLVVALTFLVTAFDLMYILVPFVRPWLADANEDGQGQSMGNGFGGGMGGMMNGSNNSAQKKSILNRQWVSDEAINAVKSLGGSAQSQTSGGMGGGFGGGMGGGFGGGMGQMGMAQDQESNTKKTVLGDYFKKRLVVLFILGAAIVVLTGSTVMGFGMDVGTWILKVVTGWVASMNGAEIDFGA